MWTPTALLRDMILDHLDNALLYGGLGQRIAVGLAMLNEDRVRNAAPGKYQVDGDNLFYVVSEYETKPVEEGKFEIHRRYMDIQYIVSGCECIGVAVGWANRKYALRWRPGLCTVPLQTHHEPAGPDTGHVRDFLAE